MFISWGRCLALKHVLVLDGHLTRSGQSGAAAGQCPFLENVIQTYLRGMAVCQVLAAWYLKSGEKGLGRPERRVRCDMTRGNGFRLEERFRLYVDLLSNKCCEIPVRNRLPKGVDASSLEIFKVSWTGSEHLDLAVVVCPF